MAIVSQMRYWPQKKKKKNLSKEKPGLLSDCVCVLLDICMSELFISSVPIQNIFSTVLFQVKLIWIITIYLSAVFGRLINCLLLAQSCLWNWNKKWTKLSKNYYNLIWFYFDHKHTFYILKYFRYIFEMYSYIICEAK